MRGIERIREGEPSTERLVIGRFDAYVVGFECCGYEKMRIEKKLWEVEIGIGGELVRAASTYERGHVSPASHTEEREVL